VRLQEAPTAALAATLAVAFSALGLGGGAASLQRPDLALLGRPAARPARLAPTARRKHAGRDLGVARRADPRLAEAVSRTRPLPELSEPDWATLLPTFAVVVTACVVPFAVWFYVVVPARRTELAKSKRRGEMKEYLKELAAAPEEDRKSEKWFYDKYLREAKLVSGPREPGVREAVEEFEGDLQRKLPGGGFLSFDNPVFVYLSILTVFLIIQTFAKVLGLAAW